MLGGECDRVLNTDSAKFIDHQQKDQPVAVCRTATRTRTPAAMRIIFSYRDALDRPVTHSDHKTGQGKQ